MSKAGRWCSDAAVDLCCQVAVADARAHQDEQQKCVQNMPKGVRTKGAIEGRGEPHIGCGAPRAVDRSQREGNGENRAGGQ